MTAPRSILRALMPSRSDCRSWKSPSTSTSATATATTIAGASTGNAHLSVSCGIVLDRSGSIACDDARASP